MRNSRIASKKVIWQLKSAAIKFTATKLSLPPLKSEFSGGKRTFGDFLLKKGQEVTSSLEMPLYKGVLRCYLLSEQVT